MRLSGQILETLIFPLEVYLDSNVYQYLEGSPEEELISSFQNKYQFDLYKLKYVSSKQLLLPREAIQLTLDLDEPRTNGLLLKNNFSADIEVGYEQTVDIYEFNKAQELCFHSREVRILDTESECEVSSLIKANRSESHLVIPLIKKHLYLHPQFMRLEFIFFDIFRLELEEFALKVNI